MRPPAASGKGAPVAEVPESGGRGCKGPRASARHTTLPAPTDEAREGAAACKRMAGLLATDTNVIRWAKGLPRMARRCRQPSCVHHNFHLVGAIILIAATVNIVNSMIVANVRVTTAKIHAVAAVISIAVSPPMSQVMAILVSSLSSRSHPAAHVQTLA